MTIVGGGVAANSALASGAAACAGPQGIGCVLAGAVIPGSTVSQEQEQIELANLKEPLIREQERRRRLIKQGITPVVTLDSGLGLVITEGEVTVESDVNSSNITKRKKTDPPNTYRDANGRLRASADHDQNTGSFVGDPNKPSGGTTSERLRSAQNPNFNVNRKEVLQKNVEQNAGVCEFCQENEATQADHFKPVKQFADEVDANEISFDEAVNKASDKKNLVPACGGEGGCNQIKGAKPTSLDESDTGTFTPKNPTDRVRGMINSSRN